MQEAYRANKNISPLPTQKKFIIEFIISFASFGLSYCCNNWLKAAEIIKINATIVAGLSAVIFAGLGIWHTYQYFANNNVRKLNESNDIILGWIPKDIPVIVSFDWGETIVRYEDHDMRYEDCIIFPNGSIEWKWVQNPHVQRGYTQHGKGIHIKDLEEYVLNKDTVKEIILTQGVSDALKKNDETIEILSNTHNKKVFSFDTLKAISYYNNSVIKGEKGLAILVHSTC